MKWRWLIVAGFALFVLWLIWLINKPTQPKLHEIRWEAPARIKHIIQCDLDGDKSDEVLVKSGGKWWWLRPSLEGWKATQLPIKVVVTNFVYKPLHFGILARDEKNALCFVYYRNGWEWRKFLDAPVHDLKWLDIDGDGKVNDVLVLSSQILWWFRIGDDGKVVAQDWEKVPSQVSLFSLASWSKQGKLVVSHEWEKVGVFNLDWDKDGISEIVHLRPVNSGRDELMVHFSSVKMQKRFVLPKLTSKIHMNAADIDGDGRRELIAIASQRIIVVNQQGAWHFTPCSVVGAPSTPITPSLWVTRIGRKDRLWVGASDNLWLLRHDGKGYQVRHWKFHGFPLAIWQDKRGTWFAFYSQQLLYSHRWLAKVLDWLRSLRIPIRIPRAKINLHLWRWDEKRDEWTQVGRIRIPTKYALFISAFKIVDLNGDGEAEWMVMGVTYPSVSSEPLSPEIGLFTGQLHFIGGGWYVLILRQGQRKWIVTDDKNPKILHGVTLTSVQ